MLAVAPRAPTRRVAEAEADARAGLDLSRQHELPLGVAYASAFLADALIETGQLSAASAVLAEADPALCPFLWDSRGRLHHHEGRCAKAFEDFAACGRMLAGRGRRDCPEIIPWRSGAALARASLGDVEEARALVAEELRLAADQGAPRALGVALRAAGLVEGGGPGLDLLREAVRTLQASAAVLEHARALIDLGAATRRVGRRSEARDPLRRGLDLAHRCGATALAASARHELLATGARPRRLVLTGVDALTASERRVALLAAEGRTNRQIAQALFISMRTVAIHLSHAYQKLGISGREQLADALESDPDGHRMADGAAR